MKRILIILSFGFLLVLGLFACKNQERIFPDFDYTTSYFPYQYPIRTLVLGDYYFDNSKDKQLKFMISATMGGVYDNKEDRVVEFVVDDSLTSKLYVGTKKILPLPRRHYTLSHNSQIIIPKGQLSGGVEEQLTPDFLNDQATAGYLGTTYVVPLRIVKASTDSVLVGKAGVANPDVRIESNWVLKPKNFTLFGINYVNEFHGKYLMRGASQVVSGSAVVESNVYRNQYVEKDQVVDVITASRNAVMYTNRIVRTGTSPGNFEMLISFDENGNGTIDKTAAGKYPVKDTARFAKNTEIWGGEKRHAIYLNYQVTEGTRLHNAKDTLVFRDKGVSFQEFVPAVK